MIFIYSFLFFLYLQSTKNRKRSAYKNHETQWTHKQAKHKKLKSLKKDEYTCNKTKLESNRNTSPNATEYSNYSNKTCNINVNFTESRRAIFRVPFFNLIFKSI